MIKLVYCVRKRADLSTEAFSKYWLEQHGPLVRGFAEAIRARKYIQSHTIAPDLNALLVESRGLAAPYDGITEVWWDNEEAFKAGMSTPQGQEAHRRLKEDEATFIDFAGSRVFITREHPIFDL
jgi:uncharacterized protein (TIGR02118 family)